MSVTLSLATVVSAIAVAKKVYEVATSSEFSAMVAKVKDVFSETPESELSPKAMGQQTAELRANLLQYSNETYPHATGEMKQKAAKAAAEKFQDVLAETRSDSTPGVRAKILGLFRKAVILATSPELKALVEKIKSVFSGKQPAPALAPTEIETAAAQKEAQLLSNFAQFCPMVPEWRRQEAAEKAAKAYQAILADCMLEPRVSQEAPLSQLSVA